MPDTDQLSELIAGIYDAAAESKLWPTVLMRLSDVLQGTSVVLRQMHGVLRQVPGFEIDFLATARFDGALYQPEHLTPAGNPGIREVIPVPPGTYIPREAKSSDSEHRRCAVYNDVLRPQGLWHASTIPLLKTPSLALLSVFRRAQAPFEQPEVDLLLALVPHLQRALQIARRLLCLEARQQAAEAIVAHLPHGVILLDADGAVLLLNPAAEAIVAAADGLTVRNGRLVAASAGETARLRRLIGEATATGAGRGTAPGGALALSRPSLRRSLAVLVAPLRLGTSGLGPQQPAAAVFVSDPERVAEPAAAPLGRLFGLTPREAALAARLAQGQNLKTAAHGLAMAPSTARSHLKAIFDKTGAHHQADLVQLVLRSPASLG